MGKSEIKSLFRSIPVLLSIVLALVTMIAAFSGNFDPANSRYMPVLGLALPALLLCNLLVAICWAFARRRWAFIPLAALVFNYGYILAIFQFSFTKKIPEGHYSSNYADGYLKIATYNVGNFGGEITGYSCKEIARYMKEQEVDVLCFQECGDNKYFPHPQRIFPLALRLDPYRGFYPRSASYRRVQPLPARQSPVHFLPAKRQL